MVINEAHHQPMHRVFTTGLLKELYDLGYKYLAVEDLNHRDSFLSKRKYPTTESGYFIKEPQFGNLIREALNLGFSLVPYDFATENIYEDREKNAAENIKKIMDKDPLAKIVIHCGYDHVFESETSIGKPMTQYLAEQTGINPLTIDQENYTERSEKGNESPFLRLSKITESSIYLDSGGHVFSGRRKQKKVDIKVFHPYSNYYFDRPNWLISTQSKKWYFLPIGKVKIAFPILIQVYKRDENSSAIPIDIIEILNASSQKPLALYNGDFNFEIINSQKQEQVLSIKVKLLTHDSYVIQTRLLPPETKTKLERVLQIFNPKFRTEDTHKVDFTDEVNEPIVQKMVNRLQKAIVDDEMRHQMDVEDEFERLLAREAQRVATEKDEIIAEKVQVITEQAQALSEKDQALSEKDQALSEKDQALSEQAQALEAERQKNDFLTQQLAAFQKQVKK